VKPYWLAITCCLLLALAAGAFAQEAGPAGLETARRALEQNLSLGRSFEGKSPTPEQAAEAQRLLQECLALAREGIADNPRSAEAHRLAGLLLCTAYRPVSAKQAADADKPGEQTVLLQQGGEGCEEGLAQLRSALRLAPTDTDCYLDYAEALLVCGDDENATKQALAIWEQRSSLTEAQSARCASVLSKCAAARNATDEEVRWLREVVKHNPQDTAAKARLARLAPTPPSIAWCSYEDGKALAEREKKPMLVDCYAEWCGWCKKLDKEVFTDPEVINLCQQFVCIKVDVERRRDLSGAFRVGSFPTAVVLDRSGREVYRIVGYKPAAQYAADLRRALPPA